MAEEVITETNKLRTGQQNIIENNYWKFIYGSNITQYLCIYNNEQ